MNTTMIFLLRLVGAVGVAAVFYAMLAGPVLLLGDGAGDTPGKLPRLASRCMRMQRMSNRTDAVPLTASDRMAELLHEALAFQAEAFDADFAVDGGDMVDFFAGWRAEVKTLPDCTTPYVP